MELIRVMHLGAALGAKIQGVHAVGLSGHGIILDTTPAAVGANKKIVHVEIL